MGLALAVANAFGADPPIECRTVVVNPQVALGEPCTVEYIVEWQGARDACIVLPLTPNQPDWGAAALKSSRSEQDGQRWRVVQSVEYTPTKAGKYSISPAEVTALTANQPIVGKFDSVPGTLLKMEGASFSVTDGKRRRIYGFTAVGLFVLLLAGVAARRYVRRGETKVELGQDAVVVCRDLLHEARRCRLDGDSYGCYQSLLKSAEALQTVAVDARNVADAVRSRIPAVGFQGVRPTDDEMDGLFRDIERIIARRNTPPVSE